MEDYKYLFKVVLVGNAGVGKTCLVRKFTQLQIWDTAGQERFRSITQSYYRSAHAIVLVYDVACQPSFDCLPEWLAEIESYANRRVLKILVGNKVDKGDEREVPERVGQDFSEVNGFDYFLETSALDATNVDNLFEHVARRLTNSMKATDQRFSKMESYAYLFKIILVGGTGVGKTSLVQRFTQGIFNHNTLATVGVDFRVKNVNVDNDEVKLQIWDPSGQERFRTIVHLYYRNAEAVVFVYDLTHQRTFDRLPDWMDEIEKHCTGRVVKILVGNKADKVHDREVPMIVARDFAVANHFDYFTETSALDATNVDLLFQQVARRLRDGIRAPSFRMCSRAASYRHGKYGDFTQTPPVLHNPFIEDPMLRRTLRRVLPDQDYKKVEKDLSRFGARIVNEIDRLGRMCEVNQPKLEQFDAWGRRVDQLIVCPEWNRLKEICAEEGLISIGYDDSLHPMTRRIHQFAKIYLFSPSAGLTTCPMAMTDGAVKTLKALGLEGRHDLATASINRLRSTDGKKAWTSGQWMTEKRGGSDVGGGCDTYAEHVDGDKYRLYGYKWFSSAIDADIALTLARIVDKNGNAQKGSRGLSLFLLKIRNNDGQLNGIQMMRLKNKFGTKQLPTAELLLDGTVAYCLGQQGRGVASIANMLNITRIHNAVASVSGMRRIVLLARDYSTRREVFGQKQEKWPLHTATLAKLEVETRGCFLLLMEAAQLLGLSEADGASESDAVMLRLVTPIVKLYTGKICVPLISEAIECFGGQGYIEDTGLPAILRDAQVTPIWEGTTNVLSLDVLRVFSGKQDVYAVFEKRIESLVSSQGASRLKESIDAVRKAVKDLGSILKKAASSDQPVQLDSCARRIAFGIARIYAGLVLIFDPYLPSTPPFCSASDTRGALLIRHASDADATESDADVAARWCLEQPLVDLNVNWLSDDRIQLDRSIVFENFPDNARNSKL
ncbi:hypothetical protein GCK32_004917 [Trichostrongylus colubriformis]|uniref:Uncharacterized protein n=1 Tax=Trichostrongylus colubriformis TaxID=6319 RepID=A0AAN8GBY8_TRICO